MGGNVLTERAWPNRRSLLPKHIPLLPVKLLENSLKEDYKARVNGDQISSIVVQRCMRYRRRSKSNHFVSHSLLHNKNFTSYIIYHVDLYAWRSVSLLVHIVELSTAVAKVDIKVIRMLVWIKINVYKICNAVFNACWNTPTATPLNWTMTSWSSWATSTTKQNRI